MPTSTRTKAAKTTPVATEKEKPVFYSIGSLFSKENGWDLVLERSWLDALGFETRDNRRYSLHIKHKVAKSGFEFDTVFLCDAPQD